MNTQVDTRRRRPQTPADVEAEIKNAMDWFAKVAPAHVNPEQFVALALGQIRKDPELASAAVLNPGSLMVALVECARLGLVVGVTYHLTHFRNQRTGVPEIVGIVDYKGEIEMIYRAGGVSAVHGQVVRGGPDAAKPDHFDWRPGMTLPEHVIADGGLADEAERGPLRGVYAYATLLTGGYSAPIVMPRSEVMRHKAAAKTMKFWEGPWEPAMWLKGLAVSTQLPTPSGWTTMGAVRPGDCLLDKDGQPTRVIATSEVKQIGCYRLTFRSGRSIVCDEEHRWLASIGEQATRVHDVAALYRASAAGRKIMIPAAGTLDLPAIAAPVDPYVLGYWLGDGRADSARITCHNDDLSELLAAIRSGGHVHGKVRPDPRGHCCEVGIRGGLTKKLADIGVLGDKHVPQVYARAATEQRLALLRGLMDSDGTVWQRAGTASRVRFFNTSRRLRDDVAELARSLGEIVLTGENDVTGFGRTVRVYVASWTPAVMPFALGRKAARTRLRSAGSPGHSVRSIELTDSVPTKCIAVDSPSRTYLAGSDMIPTHNTAFHALYDRVPHSPEFLTEMVRASAAAAQLPLDTAGPALPRGFSGAPPIITAADMQRPDSGSRPAAVTGRRHNRDAPGDTPPDGLKALHEHLLAMEIADQDREAALAAMGMLLRPDSDGPPVPVGSLDALDPGQQAELARKLGLIRTQAERGKRSPRDDLMKLAAAAAAKSGEAGNA